MTIESVGAWIWDKFGKEIVSQITGKAKGQWAKFEWNQAAEKYKQRMQDLYSTTRMLGKPEPVSLEGIFTDVYLLDRPTALERFDIEELKARHVEYASFMSDSKRASALRLASQQDRLFILGKPGAGKTTFLKYLTLQAAMGKLDRVPIFLSLNDWATSGLDLLPFVQRQFEICDFPDASAFIRHLFKRGAALICFDGLDEVNEAEDKRAAITRAMRDFTNQYPTNKYLITCRIAATDYSFEKFTYVEMADFTPEQVQIFARKWFAHDEAKTQRFVDELKRPEHRGLRELARTPLLLTLLCLNFEETLTFPARRAELYEEALDALLKKWDASRNIKRDEVYRGLSLGRKRQLLARVATEYFERGEIFFRQSDLVRRVSIFLKNLPGTEAANEPDGAVVVKAVEAQHGIFVERARRVYSFSHLTLQEYFTARYLVEHAADGVLDRLINQHLTDDRWREVFELTASMLPEADGFFVTFQRALDDMLRGDERLLAYGRWSVDKANDYAYLEHPAVARAIARSTAKEMASARAHTSDYYRDRDRARDYYRDRDRDRARDLALNLNLDRDRYRDFAHARDRASDHARDHALARALARELSRDYNLTRDHDLAGDLAFALDLGLDFYSASDFNPAFDLDLDLDRGFIEAWLLPQLNYRESVRPFIAVLAQISWHAGQADLFQALNDLPLPSEKASEGEWQAFTANFQGLLIRFRNIGHDWNFTDEQQRRLDQYEQGTVLLAECLQLAAVSDRKAIENRLLLPPEE